MLGFDFSSFDCQTKRDATYLELIRSLGKREPAFGPATFGAEEGMP
jgi:hypothetical protein